ncbi:hypothetical protein TNCV_4016671 [Trichonephila clavipes]|nr:hypothetical protein TNCV_4016671 [Trichonephila clavipes]
MIPPAHKAHQTVSFSVCNGVSTYTCGLASLQMQQFCFVDVQPEVRFIAKQNSLMKIGNNGNLVLGPFDDNLKALFRRESIHDELPNHTENKSLDSWLIGRHLGNDEAHFWSNGYVNKQNCRIWSEANPQVYVETPLHPEKLTVWCALWAGGILLQKR